MAIRKVEDYRQSIQGMKRKAYMRRERIEGLLENFPIKTIVEANTKCTN